jgi:hypothetical protein
MNELDKKFQALGWNDTTEAYYGLDFTPFMSVIEEHILELKSVIGEHFLELKSDVPKLIDYTTDI